MRAMQPIFIVVLMMLKAGAAHAYWCGKSDTENWRELSTVFWAGSPSRDKKPVVYHLMSPWCPYCAQLAKRLHSRENKFEVRYVPIGARNNLHKEQIADIVADGTDRSIVRTFIQRRKPKHTLRREQVAFVNEVQLLTNQVLLERYSGQVKQWGSPMTLFFYKGYILVKAGLIFPTALEKAAGGPNPGTYGTDLRRFLKTGVGREKPVRGMAYAKRNNLRLRVLPDEKSLAGKCVAKNTGFKPSGVIKINGVGWLVFRLFRDHQYVRMYGRADQFHGWSR